MIKWFIRFFKIVPLRVSIFFSNDFKVNESVYHDGLTTNNDYQSFRNLHCSKFENIFIFHLLFKLKHHPILRKKPNEKLFFWYFFLEIQNTFFFVLTRVKFFVIKFIDTKTWKHFFQLFLQKITTHVSVLLSIWKRNIRTKVSLHVS